MGIFKRQRSKSNSNSEAIEDYKQAEAAYQNGDYTETLRRLSWGFRKDIHYLPLYELAEKTLTKFGAPEEAQLFRNARKRSNSFEPYRQLGMYFYDQSNYDMAMPFYKKAVELNPKRNDVVHDLAIVYARLFRIKEAIEVLETNKPTEDFYDYWYMTKLRILDNQTEGIENDIKELYKILENVPDTESKSIAREHIDELKETFERRNLVGDPKYHIRDWHFIQYGDAILDFLEDTDDYVAGGRYVASWGTQESIKEISSKLKIYLDEWGKDIETVLYVNNRNSKIIGLVIAQELNVEAKIYDEHLDAKNALIVGASSIDFDGLGELPDIRNGQVLFALNHYWLASAQISPDICGFMAQSYVFPWAEGHMRMAESADGQDKIEQIPADTREESVIAEEISKLEVQPTAPDENLSFYIKYKEHIKGIGTKTSSHRYNFTIESPVTGSYFY